jgi:hypothetical protein
MTKADTIGWLILVTAVLAGCRSADDWGFGDDTPFLAHPGRSLFERTYFIRDEEKSPVPDELQDLDPFNPPPRTGSRLSQQEMDAIVVFSVSYFFDSKREHGLPPDDYDYFVGVRDGGGPWGFSPPSPSVLHKLIADGFEVASCSQARFPLDDERDPNNPKRFRGIENATTGRPAKIVYVQFVAHCGDMVVLSVGFTGGALFGGGDTLLLQRVGQSWKIHSDLGGWVS